MLLKDEIGEMGQVPKREALPITQKRVIRGARTPLRLVWFAQCHTTLEETLTNERAIDTRSDLLLDIVTGRKHRDTSTPEMGLIIREVVSRREEDRTLLEATSPIPEPPLGCLRKRKLNG